MRLTPVEAPQAARASQVVGAVGGIIGAALMAATASLLAYVVINEPEMRAAAERQKAEAIERENRAFCHKFRVGPGTGGYATCADELMQIRRQHEERIRDESAFI